MSKATKRRQMAEDQQIMAALRKAKKDVKADRTKSHAEVEKLVETWIRK